MSTTRHLSKLRKKEQYLQSLTKKQLIDKVQNLEKELDLLRNKVNNQESLAKNPSVTIETQTLIEDDDISFPCKLCVYEAIGEFDLRIHMEYAHDMDFDYGNVRFKCRKCQMKFQSKQDLMMHIKSEHTESLPNCRYFQSDTCKFTENSCWFNHRKTDDPSINCRYCRESFNTKKYVMIHQKENHEENVQICKNFVKKTCKFKSKCWYLHVNYKSDV